jgi:hypothetical protein
MTIPGIVATEAAMRRSVGDPDLKVASDSAFRMLR